MKLPDNLKIKVNKELFEKYLFNDEHTMGKHRATYLAQVDLSNNTIDLLIAELMRIPTEQNYLHI